MTPAPQVLHGVFLRVFGIGVLLTGDAGSGKSELALELISRGHSLIADDAAEFSRQPDGTVLGCCPPVLRDFLEVRGLGILDIRAMFGDGVLMNESNLDLIVRLRPQPLASRDPEDRVGGYHGTEEVLGVTIPVAELRVAPGRNLAVLLEVAVRRHLLARNGYDAAAEFVARHGRVLRGESP